MFHSIDNGASIHRAPDEHVQSDQLKPLDQRDGNHRKHSMVPGGNTVSIHSPTQSAFDRTRRELICHVQDVIASLKVEEPGPSQLRSMKIATAKINHQVLAVAKIFNTVAKLKPQKRLFFKVGKTPIENKYTPTALAILQLVHCYHIDLDRWILAQMETVKGEYLNLFHCYGLGAWNRYWDWEKKQGKRYTKVADRSRQTDSLDRVIVKSISRGHKQALKWIPALKRVAPPNLSAALLYMFPQIPFWYLLSYECFRTDVMEAGLIKHEAMVKMWKKFKRSETLQDLCEDTLTDVISTYGPLEW